MPTNASLMTSPLSQQWGRQIILQRSAIEIDFL